MVLQRIGILLGLMILGNILVGCGPWDYDYGLRVTGDIGQVVEASSFFNQDNAYVLLKLKWNQKQLERKISGRLIDMSLIHSSQSLLLVVSLNDKYQFLTLDTKTLDIKEKWSLPEKVYSPQKKVSLEICHIEKMVWEKKGDTLALGCTARFRDSNRQHIYRPVVIVANASTGKIRFVYIIDKHPYSIKIEENSTPYFVARISRLVFSSDGNWVQLYGDWLQKCSDTPKLYYSASCNVIL